MLDRPRRLNPGWTVHVLDQETVWRFISREDLPRGFDRLKIQHRSDAIRLALLVKYGGVWLDATVLLLRPLNMMIQDGRRRKCVLSGSETLTCLDANDFQGKTAKDVKQALAAKVAPARYDTFALCGSARTSGTCTPATGGRCLKPIVWLYIGGRVHVRFEEADPSSRFFYVNRGLKGLPTVDPKKYSEHRYTADFHVENWFFASPPQDGPCLKDPLMTRTLNCVKRLHDEGDTKHLTEYPEVFTPRQVQDLHALGEWAYIATDACIFKTLDEDDPLTRHLNPEWFENQHQTMVDMFYRVNPQIVQVLTDGELFLLKFTTEMRGALIDPISPLEMYGCVESSWSIVLLAIGLSNITKCDELHKPGANEWVPVPKTHQWGHLRGSSQ
eukprot:s224_g10.t1